MGIDKFDNRYKYYLYPTNNVEECIEKGINMTSGNVLCGRLDEITSCIYDNNLNKFIENNYEDINDFIIVKIPVYYMGWRHRNGVKESFVPILKCCLDIDTLLTKTYLIPELIYGTYDKKLNMFYYNDKYNLFYNPCGLQFCSEQIENMFDLRCYDLYQEALYRIQSDYNELCDYDIRGCKWDKTVKYYKSSKIKKKILNINKNKFGRR